jgi:hypothetical protein
MLGLANGLLTLKRPLLTGAGGFISSRIWRLVFQPACNRFGYRSLVSALAIGGW